MSKVKVKTHKGAAKRIARTKSGKIKRRKAGQGHKLEKKTQTTKRTHRKMQDITSADTKNVRRLMGW